MKETGIVRRMDELGRIVIPKEIRKRMAIDNGDLVDIFVGDKKIILTKYHPLSELSTALDYFVDALKDVYSYNYLLIDKELVISSSLKELIGKKISKEFYKKVKDYLGVECPLSNLNLDLAKTFNFDVYILAIDKFSDIYGYVIIIDNIITQKHKEFCSILNKYISSII